MWKIQLFKLNYDDREVDAVAETVRSGWITMGEKTAEFEKKFGGFLETDPIFCTAVSSGTAALHMALLASGAGPGDEVIIPALTFVADINVVRICGARPVLADCTSYHDWNISPIDIERKITDRTRAVIIVHYAGWPCDMDRIKDILNKVNRQRQGLGLPKIMLIEDAAHAPGAAYSGRKCGTMGDIGCFSFFTNKNLSLGEGGMFVTRDENVDRQARYLRSHGMTSLTLDRHKGRAISYDVICPGLNYRLDEMRAALGLVQLQKLPEGNLARERLVLDYRHQLQDVEEIQLPFLDLPGRSSAYHIFPILLENDIDRNTLVLSLKENGIQASIHYPAFHDFTAYKELKIDETPIASDIANRELTLPLYPTMTSSDVEIVCEALKKALRKG